MPRGHKANLDLKLVEADYKAGISVKDIAIKNKCSTTTVHKLLSKHNLIKKTETDREYLVGELTNKQFTLLQKYLSEVEVGERMIVLYNQLTLGKEL